MKKYPKRIYGKLTPKEYGPNFLEVREDLQAWEHGSKIAVYELKEIKTLVVKPELVR